MILVGSAEGLAEAPASCQSPGKSLGFEFASLFVVLPTCQCCDYLSSTGFFTCSVVVNRKALGLAFVAAVH